MNGNGEADRMAAFIEAVDAESAGPGKKREARARKGAAGSRDETEVPTALKDVILRAKQLSANAPH